MALRTLTTINITVSIRFLITPIQYSFYLRNIEIKDILLKDVLILSIQINGSFKSLMNIIGEFQKVIHLQFVSKNEL